MKQFLIFVFFCVESKITQVNPYISNEEGFKQAGEMLKLSMNLSVDPCQDFYEFACGNWKRNNLLPEDMTAITQFTKLKMKVFEELRELKYSNALKMAGVYYKSCMEEEKINQFGLKEMLQDLTALGYFPLLHWINWEYSDFDLTNLLKKVSSRGLFLFIDITASQDVRDSSKKPILIFSEASLGLGEGTENYYLDRRKYFQQISAYKKMMIEKVKFLTKDVGQPVDETKIEEDIESVLEFETKLSNLNVEVKKINNSTAYVRLNELDKIFPLIRWKEYLLAFIQADDYLSSNPEIKIPNSDYFQRLAELITQTNSEVMANYIFLRFIDTYALQLGTKYDDLEQNFLKDFFGRQKKPPRWKECITEVKDKLSYATGALYARKYFDKETEKTIRRMLSDLFEEFHKLLREADWMSRESRSEAEIKINKMKTLLGSPKFFLDSIALDKWHNELNLQSSNNSFGNNRKRLLKWKTDLIFKALLEGIKGNILGDYATTTNAFYLPSINGIILPTAFLQAPFFSKNYPKALNYGAIGSILAHEITHALDDYGREFDENGNYRTWWDDSTTQKFVEKSKCLQEKYGAIEVEEVGLKIDGKATLGENIADNAGIKQSFRAYQHYISRFGVEKRVPGFEKFDNYQLFFIGYAQNWCGQMTKENTIRRLLTDNHALSRYRVNLVLANKPEFGFAFKCHPTSPMISPTRCDLW